MHETQPKVHFESEHVDQFRSMFEHATATPDKNVLRANIRELLDDHYRAVRSSTQVCIPYSTLVICLALTLCCVMLVFAVAAYLFVRSRRIYMTSAAQALPSTYRGLNNCDTL